MSTAAFTTRIATGRWAALALAIGLAALAGGASAVARQPVAFYRAYLFGWTFVLGLSLGGMALVMIHHLTGGVWGLALRRILEAQMRVLPLVALLFVPLVVGTPHLYPWAHAGAAPVDPLRRFFSDYFQRDFFFGRAIVYFVVWILLAWRLGVWSRAQDETSSASPEFKAQRLSGPGLALYGITLHFAAIDWLMSIQGFTSTIFGPIVAGSQLLSAFALATVVFTALARHPDLDAVRLRSVLGDIGGLLFTLVIVWAYLVWFQFMLIWIADLPRENTWWLARALGGWQWITAAIALLGFGVPFFLLLFRAVKQHSGPLRGTAALVLATQFVFAHYQVVPAFFPGRLALHWLDLLVAVGLVGIWLAAFLWLLGRRPLAPRCDRNWGQAVHLRRLEAEEDAREEAIAHA